MVVRAALAILIVAASGVYAYQLSTHRSPVTALPNLEQLPGSFPDGWVSIDYPLTEQVAKVLDADVTLQRIYRHRDGAEVHMFVAYFKEQQVNSQIHSPRHCIPGGGWTVTALEKTQVELPSGTQPATRMRIENNARAQELRYWFRTRGGTLTGEYALKWDLIQNSIARRPTDAAFVRFSANVDDLEVMQGMMQRLDEPLNAVLAQAGL